jgi:hypothetical protein
MPLDDIAEGILHFLLRLIFRLFVELVFEGICFFTGFLFLRIVTLGKYPREEQIRKYNLWISTLGALILLAPFILFFFLQDYEYLP